jgi:hypothetical protein
MSALLSIRLSAATPDETAVFRAWPELCALAWPGLGEIRNGSWEPGSLAPALKPPVAEEPQRFGVRELAEALSEQAHFGNWPEERREELAPYLGKVEKARQDLDNALADWEPQGAVRASAALEDALGDMRDLLA